tara:strand:+ start:5833 stop:6831 length:999 start_codon:yes stop_codon:yes gene_type:complete
MVRVLNNNFIVLFIGLLFVLSGCALQGPEKIGFDLGGSGIGTDGGTKVSIKGPQRGVVIDFINGMPGSSIFGDFVVGVNIANYGSDMVALSFDVWDTSPLEGFVDAKDVSMTLDSALIEKNVFYGPSVEMYNFGGQIFNYYGVKAGDKTQFFAELRYDMRTNTEFGFCVVNPGLSVEKETTCSEKETISGESRLGMSYSRDPVILKSVKKSLISGGGDAVFLTLEFVVSNEGDGDIVDYFMLEKLEEGKVDFNVVGISDSMDFQCFSDTSLKKYGADTLTLPMTLRLDKKSANVKCTTTMSVTEPLKNVILGVDLDYGYRYRTSTDMIEVKG